MIFIIHFTFVTNIIIQLLLCARQALCWTSPNSKLPNAQGRGANSLWPVRPSMTWFLPNSLTSVLPLLPALVFQPPQLTHEEQAPILGPFHLLFPVPGTPFIQYSVVCHLIHWGPGSKAVIFRKPFLTTSSKIAIPVTPHTFDPAVFFIATFITGWDVVCLHSLSSLLEFIVICYETEALSCSLLWTIPYIEDDNTFPE